MKKTILCLLLSFPFTFMYAQNGDLVFDQNIIHEIRFDFDSPNFWDILTSNYFNSIDPATGVATDTEYLRGTMTFDGQVIDSVGLRQKGFSSYFASNDLKKSLKVDLNEFVSGKNIDGIKKFNLANGVGDPSMNRDFVCFDMMREVGVRAPRTAHAKVYLNDEFWGVYVIIEQVNKGFVNKNFADASGNLYKNIGWSNLEYLGENPESYKTTIGKRSNEEEDDWTDYIEFVRFVQQASTSEFENEIEDYFNVDYFLRVMAIDIMTDNWDSYFEHGRNFYMYHEPSSDQFFWIPWDYNLAMGGSFSNAGSNIGVGDPPEDPFTCPTIENGSCPYPPEDTIYQQVVNIYNFCCYGEWDFTCQQLYDDFSAGLTFDQCPSILDGTNPHDPNDPVLHAVLIFSPNCCGTWDSECEWFFEDLSEWVNAGVNFLDMNLLYSNPSKRLVQQIFSIPRYRDLYLNYACEILDGNFDYDRIAEIVDYNTILTNEPVSEESFPNFPYEDYLFDSSEGSDTTGRSIPAVKQFMAHRVPVLTTELEDLQHSCEALVSPIGWHDVVINEFVASNSEDSSIKDQNGESEDWIELYNNTDQRVDLKDFYLSDDPSNPFKWRLSPGAHVESDGYLIVWADEEPNEPGLHTNFKLAKDGEFILLTHKDGTTIDSIEYGVTNTDVPMARVPNGTGNFQEHYTTFNINNDGPSLTGDIDGIQYTVHPNPSFGQLFIQFETVPTEWVTLSVIDMMGKVSQQERFKGSDLLALDLTTETPGLYFIQLTTRSGQQTQKIILK